MKKIAHLLFIPDYPTSNVVGSVKFFIGFYAIIAVLCVFLLGLCYALYGEINLIGNICKGICYVSTFLCACAFVALEELQKPSQMD